MIIVALPGNESLAEKLAQRLGSQVADVQFKRFPDDESYVRFHTDVAGQSVALICTLDRPDSKILPLMFCAALARELGASRVGLVAPYLPYMRQDRRFQPGEAVTSRRFAQFLSGILDWLVTIDPHLHRIQALAEIYSIPTRTLHASPLIAGWIKENIERPLLIGPDAESSQWVEAVARLANAPHVILEKVRYGDRDVRVEPPAMGSWRTHTPVLVDDIISTGRTMIETVGHLRAAGMRAPVCVGVHAIFAAGSFDDLQRKGAARIVTSETIPHPTNALDIAAIVAEAMPSLA
jgi:ribose-phosphate pyrophosphokinase